MKELWTKPAAEFHGKYYNFPAGEVVPQAGAEAASAVLLAASRRTCCSG